MNCTPQRNEGFVDAKFIHINRAAEIARYYNCVGRGHSCSLSSRSGSSVGRWTSHAPKSTFGPDFNLSVPVRGEETAQILVRMVSIYHTIPINYRLCATLLL